MTSFVELRGMIAAFAITITKGRYFGCKIARKCLTNLVGKHSHKLERGCSSRRSSCDLPNHHCIHCWFVHMRSTVEEKRLIYSALGCSGSPIHDIDGLKGLQRQQKHSKSHIDLDPECRKRISPQWRSSVDRKSPGPVLLQRDRYTVI
jgi:hypothetical protein